LRSAEAARRRSRRSRAKSKLYIVLRLGRTVEGAPAAIGVTLSLGAGASPTRDGGTMEREDLVRHLAGWRDGVDPATGAALPADHPAHRSDFLRVVCAALDALAALPAGRANAGRPWSPTEDALLTQAHQAGMAIAELARAHERTPGAITARLVKLGLIALPPGLRLRGMPATNASAPP
jgi:hypothetical protein